MNRYKITRELGVGSFGSVFEAVQIATGERVSAALLVSPVGARLRVHASLLGAWCILQRAARPLRAVPVRRVTCSASMHLA